MVPSPRTASRPVLLAALAALVAALATPLIALEAPLATVATPTATAQETWRGEWIAAAGAETRRNSWHAFRRTVELDAVPARAPVRIAASDKYWLWVNGRLVVFEGQLKRGPTREDGYYDTVDLAPYLEPGLNTVAALVWYWGRSGYSHRSVGQAGFLFEARLGGQSVASNGSWRALALPAYGAAAPPHPATAITEPHIRYDARRAVPGWREPGFDDAAWPAARTLGRPPVSPYNRLVPRPVPMWRDSGLREYESISGLPSGTEGGEVVARLPYNAQVTPWLEVEAEPGRTIVIRTDTYVTSRKISVRSEYVTRSGRQEYESYGWMSGHEVRYSIPPGVRVLALGYRETGYDADFAGRFRSDDPLLDALWVKARRTLYVNMRDNHMDCPDRERAQWWGDVVVQQGQVFYSLDADTGPLLLRKAARQLAEWQRDDGALVSPIPYGVGMNSPEIPLQILASVGWYGLWYYYRYTGDEETLARAYPAVRDYLGLWRMGVDGLVEHRPGDWSWADWGDHADYRLLENAWYYLALKGAAAVAGALGADADSVRYTDRMRTLESAFYPRFWRGDHFRSDAHDGAIDDRGNALAVLAGLVREEHRPELLELLRRQEHASPYMEKYVLEALFELGGARAAMDRMRRRYEPMVESPLTTLWEDWQWREWNGYNHAWAGGPLTLLSGHAAGIRPAGPGWDGYEVFPQMGDLRRIAATVATPAGAVEVVLERDSGRFTARVQAPALHGTFRLPLRGRELLRLKVDGRDVWRDGRVTGDSTGATLAGVDAEEARVLLPPGSWTIEAELARAVLEEGEVFNLSENPIRSDRVFFSFGEPPTLAVIHTLDGRRVVDLRGRLVEPRHAIWDLTNDRGGRVAPGIYLLVARVGDAIVRRRLVVVAGR